MEKLLQLEAARLQVAAQTGKEEEEVKEREKKKNTHQVFWMCKSVWWLKKKKRRRRRRIPDCKHSRHDEVCKLADEVSVNAFLRDSVTISPAVCLLETNGGRNCCVCQVCGYADGNGTMQGSRGN